MTELAFFLAGALFGWWLSSWVNELRMRALKDYVSKALLEMHEAWKPKE